MVTIVVTIELQLGHSKKTHFIAGRDEDERPVLADQSATDDSDFAFR